MSTTYQSLFVESQRAPSALAASFSENGVTRLILIGPIILRGIDVHVGATLAFLGLQRNPSMHPILLFLHLAGVVLWVGGMFFAWVCLRPVAAVQLQPPARLKLWSGVFARFFPWVWGAVLTILASGLFTLLSVGMKQAPLHWHVMLLLGLAMGAIFVFVVMQPYGKLKAAVADQDWPEGGRALGQIRQLIGTNLILGIVTLAVASLGQLIGSAN